MRLKTGDKIEYTLCPNIPLLIRGVFLGMSNITRNFLSSESEKIARVQVKGNINASLVPLSLINKV